MALKLNIASSVYGFQNGSLLCGTKSCVLSIKPNQLCQPSPKIMCIMNMVSSQSDDRGKLSLSHIMDKARTMWDSSPQPIKIFPWNKALENFIQLILDLFLKVIKYLSIPLFAITSISEMSYCAHERKLFLVPLTLLIGAVVAGVLRDAALELSPYLKWKGLVWNNASTLFIQGVHVLTVQTHYAAVPWHLISMLIFFVLLKLPGPYYPYWGRIIIPHLVNGVLLRTLWFMFLWYWRPQKSSETIPPDSTVASPEPNSAE